jgi:hypothetical protein
MPLVATQLHRALGWAPVVIEQPELVVAEGSVLFGIDPPADVRPGTPILVLQAAPPAALLMLVAGLISTRAAMSWFHRGHAHKQGT